MRAFKNTVKIKKLASAGRGGAKKNLTSKLPDFTVVDNIPYYINLSDPVRTPLGASASRPMTMLSKVVCLQILANQITSTSCVYMLNLPAAS